MLRNFAKLMDFAIFSKKSSYLCKGRRYDFSKILRNFVILSKKVLISETVRDRAKQTQIGDHKDHNIYNL